MAAFDGYIKATHDFIQSMQGDDCRQFEHRDTADELRASIPIKVGEGAMQGIIMRGDTFIELGNPLAGSCSHLLWTEKSSLINDGRITVIGPEIAGSEGQSLPFGQILLLGGETLDNKNHEQLQQINIIGDQIEGYMLRSSAENIWARVNRDVAGRGFDFEMLGKAMLVLIKASSPNITDVEILFVTSSKEDVRELADSVSDAKNLGSDILKEAWKERGYDVDCDYDCSSCHDEDVCDDIRDTMVEIKKKTRADKAAEKDIIAKSDS